MNNNNNGKELRIAIGSDHGGFQLKEELLEALKAEGYNLHDFGTYSPESVDYPDIAIKVCEAITSGEFDRGILVCGTGIGITITANKIKGIRAGVCSEPYSAMMSRAHNDANVIGMGGRVVGLGLALEIAKAFLNTEFEGGRHSRRVGKINALDDSGC